MYLKLIVKETVEGTGDLIVCNVALKNICQKMLTKK